MPSLDTPLFSIITPVYNATATLRETVRSVQKQSESSWEHLLIDDASEDGSSKLLSEISEEDSRIRVISLEKRSGAAKARNAGILEAQGRYIAFLDADDLWLPKKLCIQRRILEQGAGFVFGSYSRIDAIGNDLGLVQVPRHLDYELALRGNVVGCLTAVYDSLVHGKVLMPEIPLRQDYGLWLKLLRNGEKAVGVQQCVACYRVRPGSLSSNKIRAAAGTWQVLRECEELGRWQSSWYISQNLAKAIQKRLIS